MYSISWIIIQSTDFT